MPPGNALVLPPPSRATPQRAAVLDAVAETRGAFTAKDLFDRARRLEPSLGLATVYRTIELLRRTGSIRPLPGIGYPAYVRCHTQDHHHHLICVRCGSVEESELCAAPSDAELKRRHGFQPEAHEVDFYGTCRGCS